MSITSDSEKSKLEVLIADLGEWVNRNSADEQSHHCKDGRLDCASDDDKQDREKQNVTEKASTPRRKKIRRKRKKNRSKGKSTDKNYEAGDTKSHKPSYTEDEEEEEEEEEEGEGEDFPFKRSIASMPEKERLSEMQRLMEFMQNLKAKVT